MESLPGVLIFGAGLLVIAAAMLVFAVVVLRMNTRKRPPHPSLASVAAGGRRFFGRIHLGPGAQTSGILEVSGGHLSWLPEGSAEPAWSVPCSQVGVDYWREVRVRLNNDIRPIGKIPPLRLDVPGVGVLGMVVSEEPLGAVWTNLTELAELRATNELMAAVRAEAHAAP